MFRSFSRHNCLFQVTDCYTWRSEVLETVQVTIVIFWCIRLENVQWVLSLFLPRNITCMFVIFIAYIISLECCTILSKLEWFHNFWLGKARIGHINQLALHRFFQVLRIWVWSSRRLVEDFAWLVHTRLWSAVNAVLTWIHNIRDNSFISNISTLWVSISRSHRWVFLRSLITIILQSHLRISILCSVGFQLFFF